MREAGTHEYRYERKFLVEGLDAAQVDMLVRRHPCMFYEPYSPRYVNNLYLDSEGLDNYYANVDGAGERHKVRIRWYGDLLGQIDRPALELKTKDGLVGAKVSYPFPSFHLGRGFSQRHFLELVRASGLPAEVQRHLRGLNAVLCSRYWRRYYATRDRRFRLTVDAGMVYYQVKRGANEFRARFVDEGHVVVELKYDRALDPQAGRVASFFPFSVTRSSKYLTGIELAYP